ncbi:MAG: hypothetical protein HY706_10185, partial [Candidatus Hydrogenedentes bacterium]|nr:hypothetical protein [Candidatus Hydrogenedentota bacterium]
LQTFRPQHYAIAHVVGHDYASFYAREIKYRETAGYPPYRRMANLLLESEDPQLAERHAALLKRVVKEQIEKLEFRGLEILGPAPATVRRVRKKYRWNLGLLSASAKRLNALARATRDAFPERAQTSKVQLKIDLDPYGSY